MYNLSKFVTITRCYNCCRNYCYLFINADPIRIDQTLYESLYNLKIEIYNFRPSLYYREYGIKNLFSDCLQKIQNIHFYGIFLRILTRINT